jgi:hypothetical protein
MSNRTAIILLVVITASVAAANLAGADWLFAGYAIGVVTASVIIELARNR